MNRGFSGTTIHTPKLTYINKIIIIISVALFILAALLRVAGISFLEAYFGLSAHMVTKGFIYQVITYPFVGRGLLEIVFGCLIVWFVGSELEEQWGRKRYSSFLLTSVLGAAIIYILISLIFFSNSFVFSIPLTGLGGMCNALLLSYAILYPDRVFSFMLIFPVKAKYFCMILIAMQLYMGFFSPAGALAWGHLGAMLSGFIFMIVVSSPRYKNIVSAIEDHKQKANRKHLKVIDGGKDGNDPPKYWH